MKLIPILFSPDMVTQILAGNKTMTRRIVKPQPSIRSGVGKWMKNKNIQMIGDEMVLIDYMEKHAPYETGDIIWVREAHYRYGKWVKDGLTKTGKQKWKFVATNERVLYSDNPPATNWKSRQAHNKAGNHETMETWYLRLGRFMPFECARIFLKITKLRTEKLEDISRSDAVAEGMCFDPDKKPTWVQSHRWPEENFMILWEKLNGAQSVNDNSWVWVITFKKIEKPALAPEPKINSNRTTGRNKAKNTPYDMVI